MASGSTHATISVIAATAIQFVPETVVQPTFSILASVGCLVGCIISPDLDIDGRIYGDSVIERQSSLFAQYWRLLWYPYREALKHRSFWSHFPLVSTLIRLIYLCCPLIIVLIKDQPSSSSVKVMLFSLVSQVLAIPFWGLVYLAWMYPTEAMWGVAGLAVSDFLHWIADRVY